MAANVRIATVAEGIFKAAKDTDSAVFMELARSESDLKGGYTGMTPQVFGDKMRAAAAATGCDIWALHADQFPSRKAMPPRSTGTRELIDAQVKSRYTSFAIDASHLFNFEGKNVREELDGNIAATTDIARYIKQQMKGKEFGLEVEVGEIGRKDTEGLILTRPEEAVGFIKALNENDVFPHVIAIANGSSHGHAYDANGNVVERVLDRYRPSQKRSHRRSGTITSMSGSPSTASPAPRNSSTCTSPRAISSREMSGHSGRMWRMAS